MFLVLVSSTGNSFKNRSFKILNSSIFFRRAIMDSAITPVKPKKVLTEAQRLAFLKGREKRMANIEKKRLEKEEVKEMEMPPPLPVTRTKTTAPEPEAAVEPAAAAAPKEVPRTQTPEPKMHLDENKIADTVAERVWLKLQEAKPKRKPYTRRETNSESAPSETSAPPPPPPTHSFTWM